MVWGKVESFSSELSSRKILHFPSVRENRVQEKKLFGAYEKLSRVSGKTFKRKGNRKFYITV